MTHVDSFVMLLNVLPGEHSEAGLWRHEEPRELDNYACLWAIRREPVVALGHDKIWDTSRTHVQKCHDDNRGGDIKWMTVSTALRLYRRYF